MKLQRDSIIVQAYLNKITIYMYSELAGINISATRKKKELTIDRLYELSVTSSLQAVDWKPTLQHLNQKKHPLVRNKN